MQPQEILNTKKSYQFYEIAFIDRKKNNKRQNQKQNIIERDWAQGIKVLKNVKIMVQNYIKLGYYISGFAWDNYYIIISTIGSQHT